MAELRDLRELIEAGETDPDVRTRKRQSAIRLLDRRDTKLKELGLAARVGQPTTEVDVWAELDAERALERAEGDDSEE